MISLESPLKVVALNCVILYRGLRRFDLPPEDPDFRLT